MAVLVSIAQIKEFVLSYPRISWTLGVFLILFITCGIVMSFVSPCTRYFFGMKFGPDKPCLGEDDASRDQEIPTANAKEFYGCLYRSTHDGDTVYEEVLEIFRAKEPIVVKITKKSRTDHENNNKGIARSPCKEEVRTWDTFDYRHGNEMPFVYRTENPEIPRGHGVSF